MTNCLLRPRAQSDIEDIWDYSATSWGLVRAEAYIRQIQRCLETLAADPRLGRSCNEIRADYRKYPIGSHVIFYRIVKDGIDVVRILHQRMDFERHL